MNEFAEEGKCLRCGMELEYSHHSSVWICTNPTCNEGHKKISLADGQFAGYVLGDMLCPAAPTEPSATVKGYARMLYKCSITLCDAVHEALQNWDQDRTVEIMYKIEVEMRDVLAAAPVEVRETPQSGEEVKDD